MAQPSRPQRRLARRPSVARPGSGRAFWQWSYGPDVLGLALIVVGLAGLLALVRPEGAIAEPFGHALVGASGWMAGLWPAGVGALGVLLISHRIAPRPWPWARMAAAAAGGVALMGLAALEAYRRDGAFGKGFPSPSTGEGWGGGEALPDLSPGGGLVGTALAQALSSWFGVASTIVLLLVVVVAAAFITFVVTPADAARWTMRAVRLVVQRVQAVRARLRRPPLLINGAQAPSKRSHPDSSQPEPSPAEAEALPAVGDSPPVRPPRSREWRPPPITMFQIRKGKERPAGEMREQARVIEETLASFNIVVRVIEVNTGPVVTQYGLEPALGVPVSRITARLNDLALRLGSSPIRIEAPVPGRRLVGIEVPNRSTSLVTLREVLESSAFSRRDTRIPLALGKDIAGAPRIVDLARMPHLLIAGATGAGKSVCVNSIVACLLSQFTPDELQVLMIDPKMVELTHYNGVPHLRMPVVTEMERVVPTLKWAAREMERRYKLFAAHSARNIDSFNDGARARGERALPYLIIIIDELADLMMMAPEEAEKTICRLAQLARATGIHLVISTQRPSVDVVTGLIKANFPARIAFAVTSQVDSRVILDTVGAERLLGRGDMLYLPPDAGKPVRLQGTYVSDQEIDALVAYWTALGAAQYDQEDLAQIESLARPEEGEVDDLYDRAVGLAQETRRMSVSLLQRRLGIGYPRAARLMDVLEEHGVVTPSQDGRSWRVTADD